MGATRDAAQQKVDDEQRDKFLGREGTCYCTAKGGLPYKCFAHGYCEAHNTPVQVQMSREEKAFVGRRAGIVGR